jgi:hypothetical protein
MVTPLPWSGARVPDATEGDAVPADLLRYGTDINPLLVLQADDQTDRDANFATVPNGTVVSCAALNVVWQKITGGWKTYGYQTSWAAPGVTWASGWTDAGSTVRREGNLLVGVITATYNVDVGPFSTTAPNQGNLGDLLVCTLPTGLRPPASTGVVPVPWIGSGSSGMAYVRSDGLLFIADGPPGATVAAGQIFRFPINFPVT